MIYLSGRVACPTGLARRSNPNVLKTKHNILFTNNLLTNTKTL